MFNKKSSRHSLALFVALALGSGTLLTAAPTHAADVSGNDLKIDAEHPTVPPAHQVDTDSAAGGAINVNSDSGQVKENTLTLTERTFNGSLYGGYTKGSGDVEKNKIFVHNKTANLVQGNVFGGLAKGASSSSGNAKYNIITLTGGTFSQNIYGGSSSSGDATHNTVNLGDGKKIFDGEILGTIYGGDGPGTGDHVTGNTLNVNTNIMADNIKNFATINFNYNSTVSAGAMLQLDDVSNKRTSVDWNGIHLTGTPDKSLTLMANLKGIDISNYDGGFKQLTLTATHEAFIAPGNQIGLTRYQRINYERNQFAGVRKNNVNTSDGTPGIDEIDVYGGESKIGNTTTDNEVTITNAPGHGKVYGGYTEGDGTTADVAKRYDSTGNKVTITGGAASELYGGYTSSSAGIATGNTVTIKGGTVRANIYGGYSVYGDATGNTINLGDGTSTSAGTIQGDIFGGRSTVTTKDQTTGNTLNVNANAAAKNIWNFSTINFNFSAHVNPANTLLTLNGTQATKLKSLDQLHVKDVPRGEGTLMENANGININEYSGAAKRTAEKTETVIDKDGATKISYKGYQFKDSTSVRTAGTDTWGGRSVIGNTTTHNHISLTSGSYTDIYGGWTSGTGSTATGIDARNQSIDNSVTLEGASAHKLTGGKTESGDARENRVVVRSGSVTGNIRGGIASGKASGNSVDIGGGAVTGQIYGGDGDAEASGNIITITKGTINGDIIGGYSQNGAAKDNIVNLGDGTTSYTATINGKLIGGQTTFGSVSNNILNIKANASATNVEDFETYKFHLSSGTVNKANTLLTLTDGTGANLDSLDHIDVDGTLNGKATLMANTHGISLGSYASAVVKTHGNKEAVIDTDNHTAHAQTITYEGYQFAQKDTTTTVTESGVTSTWGGRSVGSNSTHHNDIAVESGTHTNVYGGWTSGSGTTAADKDTSYKNKVKVSGSANVTNTVYGGFTEAADGKATGNEVTVTGGTLHDVVGGQAAGEASGNTVTVSANANAVTGGRSMGDASGNIVNLANATVNSVTGGEGTMTNNNTINLNGARVTGTVTGGSAANGTGNTLAVYKPSEVNDFAGVQNLHFYTDEMAAGAATPMLKLGTATKDIRGLNIGVARSGAAPKLSKGDKILLMKTAGGALTTDTAIQNKVEGMQGVSRRYEYEIKQEATGDLTATVTKAGFAEQAKSLVETRAGLASFVNQGADYLVQDGLAAAQMSVSASDADKGGKNAQRKAVASDGAAYQLWAGAGANSMRAESGSYVDSKGWNLGVGWAREDVQKDGAKVLFSPFVEYGRGTYDSYLDDGTHGNGKISYIGAGILGKLTQKDGLWLEGSLRAGRAKSDYSANLSGTAASYDGSNTYYGAHLGAGKTFAIKEGSSIDAYARYFWSHQNSMTATLNTGDRYEFGSVNSQRLRLGLRYSLKDKTTGEFYAGLAWEHEFAGKAGATYEGDAAPSPSLKGSSYMLELGYRFMPENSRVSYDLHLNGWQGQRKGITGGASVKWMF